MYQIRGIIYFACFKLKEVCTMMSSLVIVTMWWKAFNPKFIWKLGRISILNYFLMQLLAPSIFYHYLLRRISAITVRKVLTFWFFVMFDICLFTFSQQTNKNHETSQTGRLSCSIFLVLLIGDGAIIWFFSSSVASQKNLATLKNVFFEWKNDYWLSLMGLYLCIEVVKNFDGCIFWINSSHGK